MIYYLVERILKVRNKSGNRERCRKLSLWNRSWGVSGWEGGVVCWLGVRGLLGHHSSSQTPPSPNPLHSSLHCQPRYPRIGKVLRVLPSDHPVPRNQGWLNFSETKLVTCGPFELLVVSWQFLPAVNSSPYWHLSWVRVETNREKTDCRLDWARLTVRF